MSYGRRKIFTDEAEITAENVVREVNAAYLVHSDNRNEISELSISCSSTVSKVKALLTYSQM